MTIRSLIHLLPALLVATAMTVAIVPAHGQSSEPLDENFVVPTPDELKQEPDNTVEEPAIEPDESDGETNDQDARRNEGPPPEIQRDLTKLPQSVRRMRELILTAAKSGELEKLRDLVGIGETATTLSIGGLEGDPIEFLKEASGDEDGYEILAILIEVLEAGYVHLDPGSDDELYVWPYFFAYPLDKLGPKQKVELYRVLTAGDVEDSRSFGGYVFYRVGIKPDGSWSFFVAGD